MKMKEDEPIKSKNDDLFGRMPFVKEFSRQIVEAPSNTSFVFSLSGPWGCGKTSIINLLQEELKEHEKGYRYIIVNFNPWFFKDTEHLVSIFFKELIRQIQSYDDAFLDDLKVALTEYSDAILHVASCVSSTNPFFAFILSLLTKIPIFKNKSDLVGLKKKIESILESHGRRVIVFFDDIDRLEPDALKDVFYTTRLVACFRNVHYVLSVDRDRAEQHLSYGMPEKYGKEYLEKIFQANFGVPHLPVNAKTNLFYTLIADICEARNTDEIRIRKEAPNYYYQYGIIPMIKTPRILYQIFNNVKITLRILKNEVDFADIVGIESLKQLEPSVYAFIASDYQRLLEYAPYRKDVNFSSDVDSFYKSVEKRSDLLIVLSELFPTLKSHTSEGGRMGASRTAMEYKGRIGCSAIFKIYQEGQVSDDAISHGVFLEILDALQARQSAMKVKIDELYDTDKLHLFLLKASESFDMIEMKNVIYLLKVICKHESSRSKNETRWGASVSLQIQMFIRSYLGYCKRTKQKDDANISHEVFNSLPDLPWKADFLRIAGSISEIGENFLSKSVEDELLAKFETLVLNLTENDIKVLSDLSAVLYCLQQYESLRRGYERFVDTIRNSPFLFLKLIDHCKSVYQSSEHTSSTPVEEKFSLPWSSIVAAFGENLGFGSYESFEDFIDRSTETGVNVVLIKSLVRKRFGQEKHKNGDF